MKIQIDFVQAFMPSRRLPIVEVIEQPSGKVISAHRNAVYASLDAARRNVRLGRLGADSRRFVTKARAL